MEADLEKIYKGSCHCGQVTYQVLLNFTNGTQRCNCTYCTKTRNWGIRTTPDKFRLLQGADALSDYQGSTYKIFCRFCGTNLYYYGNVPEMGGEFLTIRVNTLDDVSNDEILQGPIHYLDGKNDNWWQEPLDTRTL
ncbi:GFA family protein [Streptococcus sanguinis]|nr:GFA family protein [Streptococcus sanguinis]